MAIGKKLLILSEAGDKIGYGHYSRCFAIRSYFIENGVDVDFFLDVKGSGSFSYQDVSIVDWLSQIETINAHGEYTHLLIDSYLAPVTIFEILEPKFEKIIMLDDYHRIDHGPDLIINPNIFGDKVRYNGVSVGG